ncbi:MAG: type II toxin-antitoxin system VapB family antitoxin [Kiritimatiellia bacterium]|jgi:Arc/MetJ family transcription regulator
MRTTVDIPEKELADAMRFTNARTKKDAINAAIAEFNLRKRMAGLAEMMGRSETFMSVDDLKKMRSEA